MLVSTDKVLKLLPHSKKGDFKNQKLIIKRNKTNKEMGVFSLLERFGYFSKATFMHLVCGIVFLTRVTFTSGFSVVFERRKMHGPSPRAAELAPENICLNDADSICQ